MRSAECGARRGVQIAWSFGYIRGVNMTLLTELASSSDFEAEDALVLLNGIAVGHACKIIANGPVPAVATGAFLGLFTELLAVLQIITEEFFEQAHGAAIRLVNFGIVVEVFVEIGAKFEIGFAAFGAVLD